MYVSKSQSVMVTSGIHTQDLKPVKAIRNCNGDFRRHVALYFSASNTLHATYFGSPCSMLLGMAKYGGQVDLRNFWLTNLQVHVVCQVETTPRVRRNIWEAELV